MTAHNTRTNTPTEQNKEDNGLILYRLDRVEAAVNEVGLKVDRQENIKPKDLETFKDYIKELVVGIRKDFEKQIDDKADKGEVADLKKQFYSVLGFFGTLMILAFTYLLNNR